MNDVFDEGINCLLFVQIYLEEVCGWYALPKECDYTGLLYLENTHLFRDVKPEEKYREGDVFLLGPVNLHDFHKLHIAIFTEYDSYNQPLLIHATNHSKLINKPGGVVVNSLSKLQTLKKYKVLYGVRRLR